MIRLMLVAGDSSKELATYLNNNSFVVSDVYTSLESGKNDIFTKIINVDKLLFIRSSSVSIRNEMSILTSLLTQDNFFSVREVIFIQKRDELSKNAEEYFSTVMKSCRSSKTIHYSVHNVDRITFQGITEILLGTDSNSEFVNKTTNVYRYEKNSDATTQFVPKNTREYKVEAFNFSKLEEYEKRKELARKTDTLLPRYIEESNTIHCDLDIPSIKNIKEIKDTDISVISGTDRDALAKFTTILANSSNTFGHDMLIIDLTEFINIRYHLDKNSIKYNNVDTKTLLEGKSIKHGISVINIEKDIMFDLLILLNNRINKYSLYIICDITDIKKMLIAYNITNRVFITIDPNLHDIDLLSGMLSVGDYNVYFVLNSMCDDDRLKTLKETINDAKWIAPVEYEQSYEIDYLATLK